MTIIGDLIKTSKYSGIAIDEYNGKFSIMSAWENRQGDVKPNFVKTLPWKDGEEGKVVPVKMLIGDSKGMAISNLQSLIEQLSRPVITGPDDDEVPF